MNDLSRSNFGKEWSPWFFFVQLLLSLITNCSCAIFDFVGTFLNAMLTTFQMLVGDSYSEVIFASLESKTTSFGAHSQFESMKRSSVLKYILKYQGCMIYLLVLTFEKHVYILQAKPLLDVSCLHGSSLHNSLSNLCLLQL
jgi:hypothetical protein